MFIFFVYRLYLCWNMFVRNLNLDVKGKENKVRVTRMIIIVIVIFAVCWLPLQLLMLLKAFGIIDCTSNECVTMNVFAQCLAYCNSCMNPILYAFFSTNYRAAFWEIISCGKS